MDSTLHKSEAESFVRHIMVIMFTDIVGSVDLKHRLGNEAAARLIGRHDTLFREIVGSIADGEVLKDLGDGFIARFRSASDAAAAGLRFQYAIRHTPWEPEPLEGAGPQAPWRGALGGEESEFDARRAAIDDQYGWVRCHCV